MSGISRMIAKQLSASLGFTDEARPALRLTDQPPKVSYDTYAEAAGENIASFYSPSVEVLNEITIPKKGLLGREAIIALDKAPDTRAAEVETIIPLLNADKRYTREELSELLETNAYKVKAMRNPASFGWDDVGTEDYVPNYEFQNVQRQKDMVLDPEFEELDYQESIITAERTSPEVLAKYGRFEASQGQHFTDETLAHWRHSIQKDTRNNEKYYFIEEFQSDLISKNAVPTKLDISNPVEGLQHRVEGKLSLMKSQLFKEEPGFYESNRDFFLDYAAAYAEIAKKGSVVDTESPLEGSVDKLIKKYNLNVTKLKEEDIIVEKWEDLPRISYKGSPEAFEKAKKILLDEDLTEDKLINDILIRYEYDYYNRPHMAYDDLFDEIYENRQFRESLNYKNDLDQMQETYNLIGLADAKPKVEQINNKLKSDLNNEAKKYLLRNYLATYDKTESFYDASSRIGRSLLFTQSNALDYADFTKQQLMTPIAPAPIKKLEEVTKIILQAAIKDAAANGVTKVVIPNVQRIAALRASPDSDEFKAMIKTGSSFYKIYDKGVRKALNDIKKSMPDIKVYQEDIPYGVTKSNAKASYTGDTISLIKARRILEEVKEGASLGDNGRPILGPELIANIFRYEEADWDAVPLAYKRLLESLTELDADEGTRGAEQARFRAGLGLPEDLREYQSLADQFLADSGETRLYREQHDYLPKDATFIDITPYINKDYVLRFNKGGLVERPTK